MAKVAIAAYTVASLNVPPELQIWNNCVDCELFNYCSLLTSLRIKVGQCSWNNALMYIYSIWLLDESCIVLL